MKVLYSWLQEFVEIEEDPEVVAERLNYAGISVDHISKLSPTFKGVITAKILDVRPHPNAEKLSLALIDYGKGTIEVVCGAQNIKPGQIVPYAPPGASLKNGEFVLEARKIRGVISPGMLCSEVELDLGEDASGIFILSDEFKEVPIGVDLADFLKISTDYLFEFELPSNRPDAFSVIGIAREISAIFGVTFRKPEIELHESQIRAQDKVKVEIKDFDLCPRYTAKVVLKAENRRSPFWMRWRLYNAGQRSISAVVDVTNYVMLETGQPLHAFDRNLIADATIIVRPAEEGETIITLDGSERRLRKGMLLIADPEKPIALAGIMGAENTEVGVETRDIIIESAHFNPASIMRTSRLLGLTTEASTRFEKRVDPEGTDYAAARAAQLIQAIAGGEICSGSVDVYRERYRGPEITLRLSRLNSVSGYDFESQTVKKVFSGLGFDCVEKDGVFTVKVPSWRADISREIDLIEEVVRVYGYDRIPSTLPASKTRGGYSKDLKLQNYLREVSLRAGYTEVVTNPMIPEKMVELFRLHDIPSFEAVSIVNPLSKDMSYLVPFLSINLVNIIRNNAVRSVKNLRIFEIAKIFRKDEKGKLPDERTVFAAAVSGFSIEKKWWSEPVAADIYDLKGLFELFFKEFPADIEFAQSEIPFLEPAAQANIVYEGRSAGFLGKVREEILDALDIDMPVFVMEFEPAFFEAEFFKERKYREIPQYPAIIYDFSFVIDRNITFSQIVKVIRQLNLRYLENIEIFDLYQGKKLPAEKKSMAVRLVFRSNERTLEETEVRGGFEAAIKAVEKAFGAEIRGAI